MKARNIDPNNMPTFAIVRKIVGSYAWNKHLQNPLVVGEKVIVLKDQQWKGKPIKEGYMRIKHNHGKAISVFSMRHFRMTEKVDLMSKKPAIVLASKQIVLAK